jgi:hypothetical protein
MPEEKDKKDPEKDNLQNNNDPSKTKDGKSGEPSSEPLQIPDKFKGKSIEDVIKAYGEAEKKLGEHSKEVETVRKQLSEWEALGKVIQGNPELEKQVRKEIANLTGKKEESEDKGKDKKPVADDTRKATEAIIISNFEKDKGITTLDPEKQKELYLKISNELADMLDPGGNKSSQEVLEGISLNKLPNYLEKAYRLATIGDEAEKARMEAYTKARQNNEAIIGSIPYSGGNSETIQLTPEQREVAKKLRIPEDKYLANLKKQQEEK